MQSRKNGYHGFKMADSLKNQHQYVKPVTLTQNQKRLKIFFQLKLKIVLQPQQSQVIGRENSISLWIKIPGCCQGQLLKKCAY